jgi:phasin family protein
MTRKSIFPEFNVNLPDWSKLLGDMQTKAVEPSQLLEAHQRNLEAWTKAQAVVAQGFQAISERQAEIIRNRMTQSASVIQGVIQNPKLDGGAQVDAIKAAVEVQVAELKELTEMVSKVQADALTILRDRFVAGMEEVGAKTKTAAKSATAPAHAEPPVTAKEPAPAAAKPVVKAAPKPAAKATAKPAARKSGPKA